MRGVELRRSVRDDVQYDHWHIANGMYVLCVHATRWG